LLLGLSAHANDGKIADAIYRAEWARHARVAEVSFTKDKSNHQK